VRPLLVLLASIGLALGATGCVQSRSENAWCGLVKKHNEVFDTPKTQNPQALAAYGQIALQAPPTVRPDLLTIVSFSVHLAHGEARYLLPPLINQWIGARNRVDAYLKTQCGANPPSSGQSA
jgi:hypothetical protein